MGKHLPEEYRVVQRWAILPLEACDYEERFEPLETFFNQSDVGARIVEIYKQDPKVMYATQPYFCICRDPAETRYQFDHLKSKYFFNRNEAEFALSNGSFLL